MLTHPITFSALSLGFALAALHQPILAQQTPSIDADSPRIGNAKRPPIHITIQPLRVEKPLEDIPAAVDSVGLDAIQQGSEQLGLDEPLQAVPGLFALNRYNFAQDLRASIRGFGARSAFGIRGIKILVDGIPETLPDGQGSVDGIDLGSARAITVIRGPASALYGNAAGGAILIESERGGPRPSAELKYTNGDFAYSKPQLKLSGRVSDVDYLLNLSDTSLRGYRAHSEFENQQLNTRLDVDLSDDAALMLSVHHTDQPLANDPGALLLSEVETDPAQARARNVLYDAGEGLRQTRVGVTLSQRLTEHDELETRLYQSDRDFANKLPFEAGGVVSLQRQVWGGGVRFTRRLRPDDRGIARWMMGLDVDLQDDDRERFDNLLGHVGARVFEQTEQVSAIGVYGQLEYVLRHDLDLTLGIRHDRVQFQVDDHFLTDGDDSARVSLQQLSPFIGMLWRSTDTTRWYANIASAFETPSTTEFATPTGGGFNTDLKPQTSLNYEIGLKQQWGQSRFDVAIFHININDEITPYELDSAPGRTFYRNAGASSRDGLELSYQRALGGGFDTTLAYTWSDFHFDHLTDLDGTVLDGKQAPGIPQHLVKWNVEWKHVSGLFASLKNSATGEFFADNANVTSVPSTLLSDARIGYATSSKRWDFNGFVGVNNLSDEAWYSNIRINAAAQRYYEPGLGRNWLLGVALRRKFAG